VIAVFELAEAVFVVATTAVTVVSIALKSRLATGTEVVVVGTTKVLFHLVCLAPMRLSQRNLRPSDQL
jgi:hypothetical protein